MPTIPRIDLKSKYIKLPNFPDVKSNKTLVLDLD